MTRRTMQRWLTKAAVSLWLAGCVTTPDIKDLRQAEIQYDLGLDALRYGPLAEAMKSFQDAVRLYPDFPQAHHGLGLVYYTLGNHPKAMESFRKALTLKPDYSEVRNNMARVLLSEGKYEQAVAELRLALENVFLPERHLAESNLGWALFQLGKQEEGLGLVRTALAQNEQYCVGYEYLGMMHVARKEYTDAVVELSELTKRCPDYLIGHQRLGQAQLLAGDGPSGCSELDFCKNQSRLSNLGMECERLFRLSCVRAAPPAAAAPAQPAPQPAPAPRP